MRVLIVDDDPMFQSNASLALREADMEVVQAENVDLGHAALERESRGVDLVLLDVKMPGGSGWEFLRELRERGNQVPVIFVTGSKEFDERVKGLELGADDYIVKPVHFPELVARIQAVLRRRRAVSPLEFGDLRLDPARRKVEREGEPIDLSPREYDLLFALVEANGETIPRDRFLKEIWGMEFDPGTNVLDVQIGRLRRKLDRHGPPLIETVRGEGYRLVRAG